MSFLITVSIAIRALLRNKMRAALTVLGIVIGISAVTTMVSVGSSAGQLMQNEIQSIGRTSSLCNQRLKSGEVFRLEVFQP